MEDASRIGERGQASSSRQSARVAAIRLVPTMVAQVVPAPTRADILDDAFARSLELSEAARTSTVRFLRTELSLAKVLLDMADASCREADRARRRTIARAAEQRVARTLAADGGHWIVLRDDEREELTARLWALTRRLREWEPDGRSR